MSCSLAIREGLKKEYCICPFCDKTIDELRSVLYDCCENPGLIDDRRILCKNCGTVYGNRVAKEFVNFYENRYIIRKKKLFVIENIVLKMFLMR